MAGSVEDHLQKLKDAILCVNCKKLKISSFCFSGCGHTVCSDCLKQPNEKYSLCKACNNQTGPKMVVSSSLIRSIIEIFTEHNPYPKNDENQSNCSFNNLDQNENYEPLFRGVKSDTTFDSKIKAGEYSETTNANSFGPSIHDFFDTKSSSNTNGPLKDGSVLANIKKRTSLNLVTKRKSRPQNKSNSSIRIPQNGQKRKSDINLPSLKIWKTNKLGETRLHTFSKKGDTVSVLKLLDEGLDPNTKDNAGWTALHEAVLSDRLEVAKILIQKGADVNVPGYGGSKPLDDAILKGNSDLVELLLSNGAIASQQYYDEKNICSLPNSDKISSLLSEYKNKTTSLVSHPVILVSGFDEKFKVKVGQLASSLKGSYVDKFHDNVTHLIVPTDSSGKTTRTIKYLLSLAYGKWIVSDKWVDACSANSKWMPEGEFMVRGTADSDDDVVKRSVESSISKEKIFTGCFFLLKGRFIQTFLDNSQLHQLILGGGGTIAKDSNEIFKKRGELNKSFIIECSNKGKKTRASSIDEKVTHVSVDWIVDCISKQRIIFYNN